jgi:hypothetical protein
VLAGSGLFSFLWYFMDTATDFVSNIFFSCRIFPILQYYKILYPYKCLNEGRKRYLGSAAKLLAVCYKLLWSFVDSATVSDLCAMCLPHLTSGATDSTSLVHVAPKQNQHISIETRCPYRI